MWPTNGESRGSEKTEEVSTVPSTEVLTSDRISREMNTFAYIEFPHSTTSYSDKRAAGGLANNERVPDVTVLRTVP